MARLISVCKKDTCFSRRQMPLEESDIKMVVQFEKCGGCEGQMKQKELDKFLTKCQVLTHDELAVALLATSKDVFSHLAQSVTCVGCRRSVEQLFSELVTSGFPTLEPLVVTPHSELSIKAEIVEPRSLFCLFYIHGPKHSTVLETITKGKSKKRCNLHSMDTHKVKTPSCWSEVWDLMSQDCQAAVLTISCPKFEETLSTYLTKHRFCTECRAKVMLAYNILIGEHDSQSEKGYCVRLFEKLRTCNSDGNRHIHVTEDDTYIEMLINMAEPELTGMNRRDRHAKTLDIAQEEVLTCLGIHIYERLHRIGQKLRQEEQTWRLLFCLGVETLRKNFECAVERKQGVSNLERMCEEIEEEERVKELRRELKRQKKKRKKAQAKSERENQAQQSEHQEAIHCECSSVSIPTKPLQTSHLAQCDNHNSHCPSPILNNNHLHTNTSCNHSFPHHHHFHHHHHHHHHHSTTADVASHSCCQENGSSLCDSSSTPPSQLRNSDCGYGSEVEGCDNCSSTEGSDICSDGMCMHEGEDCPMAGESSCSDCQSAGLSCSDCRSAGGSPDRKFRGSPDRKSPVHPKNTKNSIFPSANDKQLPSNRPTKDLSSLEDLLASSFMQEHDEDEDEEECGISEEDIRNFQANHSTLQQMRMELRENLKRRFQNMRQQREGSPVSSPSSSPSPSPHLSARFQHQ